MHGIPFLLLALTACKPPPEAPAELDELVGFLYAHVPDEEPDYLEVGAVNLEEWLVDRIEETVEGYTVDNLSQDTVNLLEDEERPLDDLAGAAVGHVSQYSVQALIEAQLRDDVFEIYPNVYTAYEREVTDGSIDCFLDGDCDWLETEITATQNFAGIEVITNSHLQFRWVDTPDGRALIQRNWTLGPAAISSTIVDLEVDQQYYLWMMLPEEGGSRNIQATWMVARLAGFEAEDAIGLVIDNLAKLAEDLDAWVESK